jgi:hypothetical protein
VTKEAVAIRIGIPALTTAPLRSRDDHSSRPVQKVLVRIGPFYAYLVQTEIGEQ